MKTLNLSTGAVILGALSASFAACSASSESTPPHGTAGATSVAGVTGSGGATGFAGASVVGSAGASVGAAGATMSVGGATGSAGYGTGLGGAPGAAGAATGTAGAATGTAGAAAMSCGTLTPVTGDAACCVAAGKATDLPIDNFEDGDNVIMPIGQRQGYWYTYGTDPTQIPAPASAGGKTFVPTAPGNALSPLFAGSTSGSVSPNAPPVYNQAGIGVGFNNHFNKSCAYDATAYKGISFWLKGTVPIKVQISTPNSVPVAAGTSGTCATGCYDPYATIEAPPPDGATWKQFTIMFSDKTTFAPSTSTAAFEQAKILDLQFQVDGGIAAKPYSFAVDDVAFVP